MDGLSVLGSRRGELSPAGSGAKVSYRRGGLRGVRSPEKVLGIEVSIVEDTILCPFCGENKVFVGVHDDEGNYHGRIGCEYEAEPWSGLSYALHHVGWGKTALFCEFDKYASESYSAVHGIP